MKKDKTKTFAGFIARSRQYFVGRQILAKKRNKLLFILLTCDLSDNSFREMRSAFPNCPMVQCWTSAELEDIFGLVNTKVMGFPDTPLCQSFFESLQDFLIKDDGEPVV